METSVMVENTAAINMYTHPTMTVILSRSPCPGTMFKEFAETLHDIGAKNHELVVGTSAVSYIEDMYVNMMDGDLSDSMARDHIKELMDIWDYNFDKTYKHTTNMIGYYIAMGVNILVMDITYLNSVARLKRYLADKEIKHYLIHLHRCTDENMSNVIYCHGEDDLYGQDRIDYILMYGPQTKDDMVCKFYKMFNGGV